MRSPWQRRRVRSAAVRQRDCLVGGCGSVVRLERRVAALLACDLLAGAGRQWFGCREGGGRSVVGPQEWRCRVGGAAGR